ncbi:MAG: acyl-CoA thioesterase [Gammaproteobacteria bacterium]
MKTLFPKDKQPTLRITTGPSDANLNGSIFGGWLMSHIDIAGSIDAAIRANGPVATVTVESLQFLNPLYPHDHVSFYTEITRVGKTSITIAIEVYAQRAIYGENFEHQIVKVADAVFIYVAVSKPGEKRLVP